LDIPISKSFEVANPDYGRNKTDNLRKFHDQLGWQAWGKLEKGGLCAGTIYRTQDFIERVLVPC